MAAQLYGSVSDEAPPTGKECPPAKVPVRRGTNVARVCFFICGVEFCERLSFYTFNGTQAFFLERLGYPLQQAISVNTSMATLCYVLTLLMGWLADVPLGRFWTITASAALYVGSSAVIAVASHPAVSSESLYLLGTMGIVPFATAGIKACLSLFGADQFDASTREGAAAQERFFSWFFAAIHMGALVAFGFLVNFGNHGGLGVPPAYGYFGAYLVAGAFTLAALLIFVAGSGTYVALAPQGESSMCRVLRQCTGAAARGSRQAALVVAGLVAIVVAVVLSVGQGTAITVASGILAAFGILSVLLFCPQPSWLDQGGPVASDADAKIILKLLPLIFTAQIGGLTAQTVMQVWFQNQACQMDLRVGAGQLSGAFFNIADCAVIVVGTPVIIGFVNPSLERLSGMKLGYSAKIYIGAAFGNLALLSAVFLEYARRAAPSVGVTSACAPEGVEMKAMSAAWMCVPFMLVGISEVYVMPTVMHVAYERSPESMRTLASIMCMFAMSVIACIVSLENKLLASYITDNLDNGRLEYVYFANIGVSLAFTALFWASR